ncbi:hypothetical protein QYE76_064017 [Lolium multiflorum]|uniref:Reverse transcriptase Ty1/copia-type domain-containing protein n=1 Tax=Lolium multiflorum TaxID=4521 RepID=A0AAD8S8H0_LOLMU|nr:hypothetical protein QYE76_064017 [Lolium multiflorum]
MVNKTTNFKKQGKPKEKGNFKKGGKKAVPPKMPKAGPAICVLLLQGRWALKQNCSKFLADLKSGNIKKKGYPKETIGYTFYHRSEGKVFVAKNGSFLEKEFLSKEVTGRKVELDEVIEPSLGLESSATPEDVLVPPAPIREEANDNDHETSNKVTTEPRRSTRNRTTPDWYDPALNVMLVDNNDDPATYEEAMMSPDSNKWQEAMKSEMGSMYENQVWNLVDLPDGRKAVGNKWIFKRKIDTNGSGSGSFCGVRDDLIVDENGVYWRCRAVELGDDDDEDISPRTILDARETVFGRGLGCSWASTWAAVGLASGCCGLNSKSSETSFTVRASSFSPSAFSPPPVAARASLSTNLRRCSRCAEAFHRVEVLRRLFSAAALSFLRRTSPFSVAGLRRRPGARHFFSEPLLRVSRSLSELYLSDTSSNNQQGKASDGLSAEILRMEADTGKDQEASSSDQASGVDLSGVTRGAWKGSDVTQHEIDWLYRSRRIPAGVSCRLPGDEIEPDLQDGQRDSLSKPPVQCGSCIIGSRQGSPFFKFAGLDSCRAWQETFFYVKNTGTEDLINLPAFNPAVPTKANWGYSPGNGHIETNRIVRFMQQMMRDSDICSDDIIRTFISRQVLPLQRRAHKISEMYGPRDPTRITGLPLSKKDAKERFPSHSYGEASPSPRALDAEDPDPYVYWTDLKMGRTHTSRPGNFSNKDSDAPSGSTNPQVLERAVPLQAEVGPEFIDKLTGRGQKHKAPEPEAGSSHAPPAKRPKKPSKRHYKRREMPTSDGPALKISKSASGIPPESSEDATRSSPPPRQSPVPSGAGNSSASPYKCGACGPYIARSPRGGGPCLPS